MDKINGVDVCECEHLDEWKHCNICEELIKTIPDRHQCLTEQDLRCDYYSNCYYKQFKRLEQENKELQNSIERLQKENKRLQMLSCANCGEKYLSPDGAELYEKNVQLQKENEELKEKNKGLLNLCNNGGAMTEIEKMFKNAEIEPIDYKLEPMGTLKFSVDDIGNTWTREQYMKEVQFIHHSPQRNS